eukprot:3075548-Amphidinium_carterae.1
MAYAIELLPMAPLMEASSSFYSIQVVIRQILFIHASCALELSVAKGQSQSSNCSTIVEVG